MILVTGGAGFVGSHLVEALVARGDRVRVVDDLSTGRLENLARVRDRIDWVEGSADDAGDAETIIHPAAAVSVPASMDRPQKTHENNVTRTVRLLTGRRLKRFIFAGSCAVYGEAPTPLSESTPPAPISPYGASKWAAECYLRAFARSHGVATIALRFFNIYGKRQNPASAYSGVITRFADRLRRDEPLPVYGDGLQTRDYVHVDDIVAALLLGAEACDGNAYNVGTGTATSVLELAGLMGRCLDKTARIAHRPPRAGDVRHATADTRRAKETLGFEAKIGLEAGLTATL